MAIEPFKRMPDMCQRERREGKWDFGGFSIHFLDTAHLMDALAYITARGQGTDFTLGITNILGTTYRVAKEFPPAAQCAIQVVLTPDSPVRPSWLWRVVQMVDNPGAKDVIMAQGNLIYRDELGWSFNEY